MGLFYANLTLRPADHAAVIALARAGGRPTIVSKEYKQSVVLFDGGEESDDPEFVHTIAEQYSRALGCAALGVINHDDSVLMYALYDRGKLRDEYVSSPEYFDLDEEAAAMVQQGGDADILTKCFGQTKSAPKVDALLRAQADDDDGFAVESERHGALASALLLHPAAVGTGYQDIQDGTYPPQFTAADFITLN